MDAPVQHSSPTRSIPWWLAFSAALLLLTGLAGWALFESQRAAGARERATQTMLVLKEALALENAVTLMESRQRGFLVDGDRQLLQRRDADLARATDLIAELRGMIRDNPEQAARLDIAERMLAARHAAMRASEALVEDSGLETARTAFGHGIHDGFLPIKSVLDGIVAEEERLLAQRSRGEARDARRFNIALVAGTGAALALLLLSMGALATQLRRAHSLRAELADAHALQRAILDAAGYMVIAVDPVGRITTFNRAACEALGYAPEEVIGRHDPGLFHVPEELAERATEFSGERGERVKPGFETLVAKARQGMTEVGQWTFVRRDGSRFPVQLAVSAVHDDDGRPMGYVEMAEDISQRLADERELRELGQRLQRALAFNRLVMDNSPDMICAIDGAGRFVAVSAASRNLLGYGPDEMVGRAYRDLVHPDDREKTDAAASDIMNGQPTLAFSNRYLRRDGAAVEVDWSAIWVERERLMFCVARDASARKRNQSRIQELLAETEAQAAELRQTNRELEGFSYTISHDLRAPLRHIDGYARMLQEDAADALDGDSRRYLDEIGAAARRMGALIDDLLAFSRLGRKPVERIPLDMRQMVVQIAGESGGGEHVQIGQLPDARADPVLMRQVWVNLVSNALKYSTPRGDDARVAIEGRHEGERVEYSIRDNGVGFDMRFADKLFGVFQRLHSPEEFEGTGVGLAIVQQIVARHGGSVRAESAPGAGATFIFDLPAEDHAAEPASTEQDA